MYRAYDRHLFERPTDTPAAALKFVPLSGDQLDPRVVVHPLVFCPPLPLNTRYILVKRDWPGLRYVLGVGRTASSSSKRHSLRRKTEGGVAWGRRGPPSSPRARPPGAIGA